MNTSGLRTPDMGKLEYIDALKRALLGLPPELQAKTLAWYEQRFVDGMAAGRPELEIARELDDPKKVALTLRANAHMGAFAAQKNPANLVRMLVSIIGLLIFNLFMIIPAAVVGSLLASLYVAAFAFYIGGVAVTASGLSGVNDLLLDGPLSEVIQDDAGGEVRTRVSIGETGVHVRQEKSDQPSDGIHITTGMDEESRATQTALGLASVLGGIVLFLVSLVFTRYAALGVKRYVQMNLSLVRGA